MLEGMLEASRGCLKEEMRMDLISNNLANAAVVGFKKDVISFQDVLTASTEEGAVPDPGGAATQGQAQVRIETDMHQGELRFTGNSMDFAVFGEGFFKVMTPEGERYTRKGNFTLDENGVLVTQQGFEVLGEGGPLGVFDEGFTVDEGGAIRVDGGRIGRIQVVRFEDGSRLTKDGKGLFLKADDMSELPVSDETVIKQGFLELSNVNAAKEMVNMIHCMRAFESYQKAIQILDGIDDQAINEVGHLR